MSAPAIDTPYIRQGKKLYNLAREYEVTGTTEQKKELTPHLRSWLMLHADSTSFVPILIEHILRKYINFLEVKDDINYTDVLPIVRNLQKMERCPNVYHPSKTSLYGHAQDTLGHFIQVDKTSKAFKVILEHEWWDPSVFLKSFIPFQKSEFENQSQFGHLVNEVNRTLPGLIAEPILMMLAESPWAPPKEEVYNILWIIAGEPILKHDGEETYSHQAPALNEDTILALVNKMPWSIAYAWNFFIYHEPACTPRIEEAILKMALPKTADEKVIKSLIETQFQFADMDLRSAMLIHSLPLNIQSALNMYTQLYDNIDHALENWQSLMPIFQNNELGQGEGLDISLLA